MRSRLTSNPPWFAPAVALLLAVSLASAWAAAAPGTLDRPAWTSGDFWTYRTNTTLAAGFNLTGQVTSTMTGLQPTIVGSETVNTYRVVLTGVGTAAGTFAAANGSGMVRGRWILTGEERFEPTDFRAVFSLLDLSVNGTYRSVIPFAIRVQNTTTFRVLSNGWGYPLQAGAAGDVVEAFNFTQDLYNFGGGMLHATGRGEWVLNFSMTDVVPIATVAGAFSAYPITERWPDGSYLRSFFAPAVGNDARTESYDRNGNLTASTTLVSYRYQALEVPTVLGLTYLEWAGLAMALVVAAVVVFALRRRFRPKAKQGPPAQATPREESDLTSGPRGP